LRRIPRRGDDELSVGKPAPVRILQAGDKSLLSAPPGVVQDITQHSFVKLKIAGGLLRAVDTAIKFIVCLSQEIMSSPPPGSGLKEKYYGTGK